MLIPLGILASAGGVPPVLPAYELLSTTTLSSNVAIASLDVSSFATDYKHLQLRISARVNRTAGGDDFTVRFNNDSSASYSTHILIGLGNGSILPYGYGNGSMFIAGAAGSSLSTGTGGAIVTILDPYVTSKNKMFKAEANTGLSSGSWNNTSTISSIQFLPVYATEILAGSRFSIYGLRG